jgi:alcohol dehydrogenase
MIRSTTAAVFHGPGKPIELTEVAMPPLEVGELIVEVTLCTICGSDLHTFSGRRSCECPTILGHEITGRVLELNGSIKDMSGQNLQPGDRVTWSIVASCGDCFYCSNSIPQKCEQLAKYGHEPLLTHGPVGGLAKHCRIMAGTAVCGIPDSLEDSAVCPANCCTATAAAAVRTAGPIERTSIAIMGTGSLGLTTAAMALQQKATNVFLADVDDARLRRAESLTGCVPVCVRDDTEQLRHAVSEQTYGRGVDVVFEMTGSTTAAETGVDVLRIGGRLILVGAVFPERSMDLSAETVVRRLLRIEGVHNYQPEDLHTAIEFLESVSTESPVRNLVDRTFSLDAVNEAFEFALENRPLRVAVRP